MSRALAIIISIAAPCAAALAQSFDCKKAGTPVERFICADKELSQLDLDLSERMGVSLNASLAEREKLLGEERRWVAERDKKCPIPKSGPQQTALGCLATEYRARIRALDELLQHQTAERPADKELCQGFLERYQAALVPDPKGEKADDSPFQLLAKTQNSGVVAGPESDDVSEPKPASLDAWARRQKPPFKFSPQVIVAIGKLEASSLSISRAPRTSFYSASTIQGTAQCLSDTSFEVRDGVAQRAADPPWNARDPSKGDIDTDVCGGFERSFAEIDGRIVGIQIEQDSFHPSLSRTVSIVKWDRDFFGAACRIDLAFEPRFARMGDDEAPDDEVKCDSPACRALVPQALALVEAVQRNPKEARKAALAKLSEPQRAKFHELEKLQPAPDLGDPIKQDEELDPNTLLDNDPLLVPLVHNAEVYLARIGHRTLGWRTYPDWSVSLAVRDKNALKSAGWIGVGMSRGKLRKASVR